MTRNTRRSAGAVLIAGLLAGCAGEGGSGVVGGLNSFNDFQDQVFTPSCATAGCHDTATRAGRLSLADSATSYDELVDVASKCSGKLRVVAEDTAASYLLDKIGAGEEPCGTVMPLGKPPLSDEEVQFLKDWILAGAPPGNEPVFRAVADEDELRPSTTMEDDEQRVSTSTVPVTSSTAPD